MGCLLDTNLTLIVFETNSVRMFPRRIVSPHANILLVFAHGVQNIDAFWLSKEEKDLAMRPNEAFQPSVFIRSWYFSYLILT